MKKLIVGLCIVLFAAVAIAGFITVNPSQHQGSNIQVWAADWTSDGSGNATVTLNMHGVLLRMTYDPGTPAPTAAYDVAVADANGVTLNGTSGTDLSATATTSYCPGVAFTDGTTTSVMPIALGGDVTISVTNAGSGKNGSVKFYVRVSDG